MMNVKIENSIIPIKNRMTEIRKNRNGHVIYQNYYNNCDTCEEIYAVYGEVSVVFWYDDNGVLRGYFYSSDKAELGELLKELPDGCIIDYLTKAERDLIEELTDFGLILLHEMHRMSLAGVTEEDKREAERKRAILKKNFYKPENVRSADHDDLEEIYCKLYELFDPRESHLPSKSELEEYIKNSWVSVYHENGKLSGFQIFKIESGAFYGYQIWNGTGAEGYISLSLYSEYLYKRYLQDHGGTCNKKADYSWVNSKNKKAKRLVEFWGYRFDGLYDYVLEKCAK